MSKMTPKDFFLWVGAMIALYWSVVAFILLMFEYISYSFPDPLSYYSSNPYQGSIPYCMASLIVLVPTYLVLMLFIRRDIAKDASRAEVWVRRWALILTLFIAGVTMVIDLITLLTTFLRGEALTTAFLLKVVVVLLVALAVFMHFIADFWGYWTVHPRRRIAVFVGVAVLTIGSVVAGFFIVGTPATAQLYRFDEQKVNDLQSLQYAVVSYWQAKQKLPVVLSDLNDSIGGMVQSRHPQTGTPYEYQPMGTLSFKLCAVFNKESRTAYYATGRTMPMAIPAMHELKGEASWQHATGRVCFERTIDPERYPPNGAIRP